MQGNTQAPRIGFCLLSGALAGFINGFFGAGGGMVLVPLLIRLGGLEDKKAFSSAVCIILPLCLVSIGVYALHGALPLRESVPYLIGGAIGGALGGLLFRKVSAGALRKLFALFLLYGGVRYLL